MTWVIPNLVLVHLETVLVSVQDRCTVYANRTIGSGIVLDAPDDVCTCMETHDCNLNCPIFMVEHK